MILSLGNDGEQFKIAVTVVYQTVGVTFRAVVAFSFVQRECLPVENDSPVPLQDEHYLAVGFVRVHSDACTGNQPAPHYFVCSIRKDFVAEILVTTFEGLVPLFWNVAEVDFHIVPLMLYGKVTTYFKNND